MNAQERIRHDARLLQWQVTAGDYGTELYIRGNRAIQIDYRRDGAVNWAKYYPDYRSGAGTWAAEKNKKETVLGWLAE